MNAYLDGLGDLFKKHGIYKVYAYCRFQSTPMRNPVLYVTEQISKEAKEEITGYLKETSLSHTGSINVNTLVAPDMNELIYINGKFLTREPLFAEVD